MACVGFHCPMDNGSTIRFEFCIHNCPHKCMSMPLLLALMRDKETEPMVYSITELPNPRQQVFLKRHNDYYIDPFFSTFALFGTAVHSIIEGQKDKLIELGLGNRFKIEDRQRVDFSGVTLSGRPDLYDTELKTLYDYKTLKSYAMLKLMDGDFMDSAYGLQLNGYKTFFYPEAEHLVIEAFVKDWSYELLNKHGMKPLERVDVPVMKHLEVIEKYTRLINGHLAVEERNKIPLCTREEVWYNENPRSSNCGVPIRCRDYCEVSTICEQYKRFRLEVEEEDKHGKGKGIYPKK